LLLLIFGFGIFGPLFDRFSLIFFFVGFAQDLLEVTASINPQQNGGGKPSSEQ